LKFNNLDSDYFDVDFRDRLLNGRRAMAHLIHVWHERNGWSHKILPALVDLLELGRVHSSQISNLRNGKLASPGPEVFLAIAQANFILFKGLDPVKKCLEQEHPELLKILINSSKPLCDDQGNPLGAGELFEIFLGLQPLPTCFDWFIEDEEAILLSAAISEILCDGMTWRQCREKVMKAYPITKPQRRERFASVMAGVNDYTAEQLDGELLDLFVTYRALDLAPLANARSLLLLLRKKNNSVN